MRASLNLILESRQPQTQEWDIHHACEENSDSSPHFVFFARSRVLVGRTASADLEEWPSDQVRETKGFNGREWRGWEGSTESERVGKRGGENVCEREIVREVLINRNHTVYQHFVAMQYWSFMTIMERMFGCFQHGSSLLFFLQRLAVKPTRKHATHANLSKWTHEMK